MSQGKSGGNKRWKKCDTPWAGPTRAIT
jgi:hypothetical protein